MAMVWLEGGQGEVSGACPPPPPKLPHLGPPPPGAFGPLLLGGGSRTKARRRPPRGPPLAVAVKVREGIPFSFCTLFIPLCAHFVGDTPPFPPPPHRGSLCLPYAYPRWVLLFCTCFRLA